MEKDMKFRSGFVSIIGRPNVGKSTLLNAFAGQKVAITSSKPQTTRGRIRAVYTAPEGQIVFVDTPGMIAKAGNRLGEYMIESSRGAVYDCDLILYLVEPSSFIGSQDRKIMELLRKTDVPVFLVITKTDTVPKEQLLPVIDAYRREMNFAEIYPVCAPKGQGTAALLSGIFPRLPEGPAYYDPDTVTDMTERQLVAEIIREKALHALDLEVPHGLAVEVESMRESDARGTGGGITEIEAAVICEKESHKAIVIGKGGSMLGRIGKNARYEIEKLLGTKVYLRLFVKVREGWRDSAARVRELGYDIRKLQ